RLSWSIVRRAAPSGVLFGANICFFFSALKLTSVADVLIVAALQPALTLLVAGPLFGERVTGHEVAWTIVSLGGVVMVILGSSGTPEWSLRGDLLAVGALIAWTVYWLLSKHVRQAVPALEYMTAVTVTAALVVTPVALLSGQSFTVRWQDWLWLVLFVAGAQGGHSLLAWSHAQVDVSISALMILAEPVISATAALILLGEPLPALSIAGGLIAVLEEPVRGRAVQRHLPDPVGAGDDGDGPFHGGRFGRRSARGCGQRDPDARARAGAHDLPGGFLGRRVQRPALGVRVHVPHP